MKRWIMTMAIAAAVGTVTAATAQNDTSAQQQEMKCASGKCGASMKKKMKPKDGNMTKRKVTKGKCGVGKCGG